MTEKLKYKVGDKVLIEAEVTERYKGIGDLRDQIEGFDIKMSSKIIMPKPKVTQAMMECWERHKDDYWSLDNYLSSRDVPDELDDRLLFSDDKLKNQHALATLIAYGPEAVEVEKEQKYIVEIPNPNSRDLKNSLRLVRAKGGDVIILASANITDDFYLTESEIKEDFQWAWDAGFAKPAEEVED